MCYWDLLQFSRSFVLAVWLRQQSSNDQMAMTLLGVTFRLVQFYGIMSMLKNFEIEKHNSNFTVQTEVFSDSRLITQLTGAQAWDDSKVLRGLGIEDS